MLSLGSLRQTPHVASPHMQCTTTLQAVASRQPPAIKNPAANSIAEKREPLKGFFPILKDYLHHHTSNWYKEYKWQVGHPLRQKGIDLLGSSSINGYLRSKLNPTICTLNAYNVFSIFVEHSERKDDKNLVDMWREEQEGVDKFKECVDKVQQSKEKGLACFCSIGAPWSRIHEFVIEVAPGGYCYIYQSYINKFKLMNCLEQMVPLTVDELIKQLRRITSNDYQLYPEGSKDAQDAYNKLFFVDIGPQHRLDFFFNPVEYSIDSIPIVPRTSSCAERIIDVWGKLMTNFDLVHKVVNYTAALCVPLVLLARGLPNIK